MSKAILLTGPPGCGKTTLIRRIVDAVQMPAGGFYTQEIREKGVRKGFEIITLDGRRGILAHVDIRSTKRVSKYGVDISVLDALAVGAIEDAIESKSLVVIDEIGPMEMMSDRFRRIVFEALEGPSLVLGTIVKRSMPFTDRVKSMPGVTVVEVLRAERDALFSKVLDMLGLRKPDSYGLQVMHLQDSNTEQFDSGSDTAHNNRGVERFQAGDLEGALADFDEAIRLNPNHALAYANRGAVLHKAGDLEGALADFDEAIRLNLFDFVTYYNRGTVRYHMGDFKEALNDFDKAIRYKPGGYGEAYNNRGETHFALGNYTQALDDFEKTLELRPDYRYAAAGLAVTLYALGRREEALSRWHALVDDDPRYYDAEWVGEALNWASSLIETARKLIQGLP